MNLTFSAESNQARLEVDSLELDAAGLRFSYTFRNRTRQNIYVFNRLYQSLDEGLYQTDANLMYTEIEPVGVVLSKKIIAVPPDIDVEKPIIPCTTQVRAGDAITEAISLALPLKPWTPYDTPRPMSKPSPVTRPAWIEIGYFVATAQGDALAKTVQTKEGPALYFYPFPASSQQLLRVGPLPTQVPVLELK